MCVCVCVYIYNIKEYYLFKEEFYCKIWWSMGVAGWVCVCVGSFLTAQSMFLPCYIVPAFVQDGFRDL